MKLLSFATPTHASYGVVEDDLVFDLGQRIGGDLKALLCESGQDKATKAMRGATADYRVDEVTFLPVIPNPGKIICVGLNYLEHRLEGNHAPRSAAPALFTRTAESQIGHLNPLVCPRESEQFDYEAELAVVIGRSGRRLDKTRALEHVAGISCYNDGSVRDWQLATSQWTPGKNFPATGGFGPWMVTRDEVAPDARLRLTCRLNGEIMQDATTDTMLFDLPTLIAHISTFTTLEPGDVIVSGTPGGVGLRRSPQVFMKRGDVVEIELEDVGILRNTVVKEGVA